MRNVFLLILFIAALVMLHGCATDKQAGRYPQEVETPHYGKPYNRKDWPHWIDTDGDCQNTRQELLIASSTIPVKFKDSRHCTVISGKWFGVYTGKIFTKASDVDIDHIVPLAHAHRHGASDWTKKQRTEFANDFENLLVVSDKINQAKSDKAPHEWLPPRKAYWCEYGKRWEYIKHKYKLIYTKQEETALNALAKTCR
ncbi:HNH endonuclease family protein [Nitrosomonas sp. Nm33]|uniref:HNH endonuclease family protein n=1 Tax=Nitrosomonas sp. Nm33 TaxID=133724 RepID=UPI000B82F65C|nr:HNH endonuclease family protein [Nitrosomonas sp. Nm33]